MRDVSNGRSGGWLRRGFMALALAMLAGCVATPIATDRKLSGQEGAVVLKLVLNGMSPSDPTETLSSIVIRRERPAGEREVGGDVVTLVRTRAVTSSTAVFSGMVEPARYRFVHGSGVSGNTTYTFPIGSMLSGFEVKPGEVSLLGTLLVQPIGGLRFVVGYQPPDAELKETFEQLFPALAAQTRDKPFNTLEMTPEMQRRAEIAPRFKLMPSMMSGFAQASDGGYYVGGRIGKVRWRAPGESAWQRADLKTWREVLTLRPYRGGLLAGGEEGLLRHSADKGKTWTALTPPDRGLIHTLELMPSGKLAALVQREDVWTVYATDDAFAGAWRKLASFDNERSINVGWQLPIPLTVGRRIGLAMPNGSIRLVDTETGAVTQASTGQSLVGVQALPDGTLIAQSVVMVKTTLVSTDDGKTWTDLNTSRFVAAIAFRDRQTAFAVAPIAPGVFPGEFGLMTSIDGGRTWKHSGSVPGGAGSLATLRELRIDRTDGSLLALLQSGTVMRSTDEGKSWSREL
ncbi:MAG TPA: sialidase family protein [Rhizobacter sp.]